MTSIMRKVNGTAISNHSGSSTKTLKLFDIAVNLIDPVFTAGTYHQGNQAKHPPDPHIVAERALRCGVRGLMITGTGFEESKAALRLCASLDGGQPFDEEDVSSPSKSASPESRRTSSLSPLRQRPSMAGTEMQEWRTSSGSSSPTVASSRPPSNLSNPAQLQLPKLLATVGVHPTQCNEFIGQAYSHIHRLTDLIDADIKLYSYTGRRRLGAIGEIGLDYDRLQFCKREVQLEFFELQLRCLSPIAYPSRPICAGIEALRFSRTNVSSDGLWKPPFFFHLRGGPEADADFIRIVRKYRHQFGNGVVHSFDGSFETARILMDELDLYIGLNGCSLKTQESLKVVAKLPVSRILLETDAPWCEVKASSAAFSYYVAPAYPVVSKPHQYKIDHLVKGRNEPCTLPGILEIVFRVKTASDFVEQGGTRLETNSNLSSNQSPPSLTCEAFARQIWRNSLRFLGLSEEDFGDL